MKPAHVRHGALDLTTRGNQFGGDGHGNFFRSARSDVQANRGMHAFEQLRRKTFFGELTENLYGFALRPDHSDVTRLRLHRPTQHAHIVTMSTSADHDV